MSSADPIVVFADPTAVPELQQVLADLQRGTKRGHRGHLRLLEIICLANHRLGEVFGTIQEPVVLALGRVRQENGGVRDGLGAVPLRQLPPDVAIELHCHCQTSPVPVDWITRALHGPDKRRIWPPPDGFVGVRGKAIAYYGLPRPRDNNGML